MDHASHDNQVHHAGGIVAGINRPVYPGERPGESIVPATYTTAERPPAPAPEVVTVVAGFNPWADQRARMALEDNGKTVEWRYGWKFTIRRKGKWNKDYQAAGERILARPDVVAFRNRVASRDYKQTEADIAFWDRVQAEIYIEGCLVRWDGVIDDKNQPMAFSRKNAIYLFMHFRDLQPWLENQSEDPNAFQPEIVPNRDQVAGN